MAGTNQNSDSSKATGKLIGQVAPINADANNRILYRSFVRNQVIIALNKPMMA